MEWIKRFELSVKPFSCSAKIHEVSMHFLYPCIVMLAAATACNTTVDMPVEINPQHAHPGMIRSVEQIGSYATTTSRLLLWWSDLDEELSVEYDITLYRIEYWTTGPTGALTFASGLVALPDDTPLRGVVSWQHGTQTVRENVPSSPSTKDGILTSIAFAGHGFLLTAPDYIGLGTSPGPYPYCHAATEANAVIDLLKAAQFFISHLEMEWPEAVFLTGFSIGGHATLAAQRTLEAQPIDGIQITASAPIAGGYNISEILFPFVLEGHSPGHNVNLGYVTTSYSQIYKRPLSSIISEPYAGALPGIYDGSHSPKEILKKLPGRPSEMLHTDFLKAVSAGHEHWFIQAMEENNVHNWSPRAPVRFYYGSGDKEASPADTQQTVQQMAEIGGNVAAVHVGNISHNATVLAAVPLVRKWFDQLVKKSDNMNQEE